MKEMFKGLWQRLNITRNTTQKLFSLLFAIVFWIFVMDTENPEMTKSLVGVPVELYGEAQLVERGLQRMTEGPLVVNVKVRGRRKDVISMTASEVKVALDVFNAKVGTQSYPLKVEILRSGIVLDSISSNAIELNFDQLVVAKKPIDIELVGTVPEPYVVDTPQISKGLVAITGPESLVNQVVHLKGQVDVTGVTSAFTTEIGLLPVDAQGKLVEGVTLETQKVQLALTVLVKRQLPVELVTEGTLEEGLVLSESKLLPSAVEVIGDAKVLDLMTRIKTTPIDLSTIKNSETIPVSLELAEGLRLGQNQSVQLSLTIDKRSQRIFAIQTSRIKLMNLAPGLVAQFAEPSVDLMIEGPESLVTAFEPEGMSVTIDLLNLAVGRHVVGFAVNLPEGLRWVTPEGSEARLELTIEEPASGN